MSFGHVALLPLTLFALRVIVGVDAILAVRVLVAD
eukprot:CAMPEP_0176085384 /NCGR_PEP_ID=MMETSP0120_2-20121206/42733_1 /TAXON_ID=160619 /ORGANISM="Kryptoperidinium foliaceum, Strain CCMP 1326" /LENGTH=34 /DNA_ID= /DNA_START= /DNA_END= /DNA_ORIENTATION=